MNLSIFKNFTSRQPSDGTLETVANLIRSDAHLRAFTQSYRQTGSKTFKLECPLFAVACRFDGGKGKDNVTGLTGMSLVDFDHVVSNTDSTDSTDFINALKAKVIADPHTLMCYTTISGNGLRIIFKYEEPNTNDFLLNTKQRSTAEGKVNRTNNTNEDDIKSVTSELEPDQAKFVKFEKFVV